MKKIVIFGATGMTGLCALEVAVKKGFQVRVLVRDPAKVPEHLRDKVEVIKGNVLDLESVLGAVDGVDGVVIVLGTRNDWSPTTELSEGTKNIIKAMKAKSVTIVSACLSVFLFWPAGTVPEVYVDINDDHIRMYEALKESGLNYIAVNAPILLDEPSREFVVTINPEQGPGYTISKWDLGAFLVDSLDEPKYYKADIGIANPPTVESWLKFGINHDIHKQSKYKQ